MKARSDYVPSLPNTEALSFDFALDEHGWASLNISVGERAFQIPAFGNTTDGLGDLVRAALQVVTGETHVGVVFDEEPQRWGLALEPVGLSHDLRRIARLTVRDGGISLSAEGWSNRAVWQWSTKPVFEGFVTTDDFARATHLVAANARERYDDETYRERWGYAESLRGFPLRGLTALEAALAVPEYRE
jgi:hypothetical protein